MSANVERRTATFMRTDLGNAERLVARHGGDLRFAPGIGWHEFDGRRWWRDVDGAVVRRMKLTVRAMYVEAADLDDADERSALTKWALASETEARMRAAVSLAESDLAVIVQARQLDADPWLFNCANGTVDLRTGELREHRREDLLTRIAPTPYIANARHDLWDAHVGRVTGGDDDFARFLRRAVGYSLTGLTVEDVLFFPHGPTATGKTSTLEALKGALGEYVCTADFETFLKRRGDGGIRNDVARLDGARLVISVEVEQGKALAEGLIKALTGGDTVAARFLYREAFEFVPSFKLWLAANARPRVDADDSAMWRRILQLPFVHQIPEAERDERVKLRLRTDPDVHAAILAWAVSGCIEWQKIGLAAPESVLAYTADYRAENDALAGWLADACDLADEAFTTNTDLRESYTAWCETNGEDPVSPKRLAAVLRAKGLTAQRTETARGWRGIRIRMTHDGSDGRFGKPLARTDISESSRNTRQEVSSVRTTPEPTLDEALHDPALVSRHIEPYATLIDDHRAGSSSSVPSCFEIAGPS